MKASKYLYFRLTDDFNYSKAKLFKERVNSTPFPIRGITYLVGNLLGRSTWLDRTLRGIPIINLFVNFLEGNSQLIKLSDIEKSLESQNFSTLREDFDVIVIGSGPGGSIAALRAAENGKSVLIIEEGSSYKPNSIQHHSYLQTRAQFRNQGLEFIWGMRPILYAEGKTLGGGSEINSGLYHRLEGQHRKSILKSFEVEDNEWNIFEKLVESEIHISIDQSDTEPDYGLIKGSRLAGLEVKQVPRWRNPESDTPHQSMQVTYLKKCLELGVQLTTSTRARKIICKKDLIEVICDGIEGKCSFHSKELVVSAGPLGTPKLLKKSKLIKGKIYLNIHPMIRVVAEQDKLINDGDLFPSWQTWTRDLEMKFGYSVSTFPYLAATMSSFGESQSLSTEKLSRMAAYFSSFKLVDSQIRLLNFFGNSVPVIRWGKTDRKTASQTDQKLKELLKIGGAENIWPRDSIAPISTVHLFGSLPLSKASQIDMQGRLIKDKRIRISDSSILPDAPWCNPQGPVMVACEFLAKKNIN